MLKAVREVKVYRFIVIAMLVALVGTLSVSATESNEPLKTFPFLTDQNLIEDEVMPQDYYTVLALTDIRDGDTFEAWILVAPRLAYWNAVRVYGVDTPETNKGNCIEEGKEVERKVTKYLLEAEKIRLKFMEFEKYGRWHCVVEVKDSNLGEWVNLAKWIKERNLTKEKLCNR